MTYPNIMFIYINYCGQNYNYIYLFKITLLIVFVFVFISCDPPDYYIRKSESENLFNIIMCYTN